jgi:hypothetical protein
MLVCKEPDARDLGRLCIATVSALAWNTSLENLNIKSEIEGGDIGDNISFVDYLAALAELGPNTTLKTLLLHPSLDSFGSDQVDELLAVIRNNYGLECLDVGLPDPTGEVWAASYA